MISRQKSSYSLDSRFRGNDDSARSPVIPAYAGIQIRHSLKHAKTVLLNSLKLEATGVIVTFSDTDMPIFKVQAKIIIDAKDVSIGDLLDLHKVHCWSWIDS